MGFRDRFFTPRTAEALMSWRIVLGVGVGVAAWLLGVNVFLAAGLAVVAYGASVLQAMPKGAAPALDPFTLSEPWRQFVQDARHSKDALRDTMRSMPAGPLHNRLTDIATGLDRAIEQSWAIARRGDEIDAAVTRIDPTRLRSRLGTLQGQSGANRDEAVASVQLQLASADRLKSRSADTVDRLRLSQVRLDELVARASEVSVGASDTDTYAHDVDDLVMQLEGLRLAVAETNSPASESAAAAATVAADPPTSPAADPPTSPAADPPTSPAADPPSSPA